MGMEIGIGGAGFAGAVLARELAEHGDHKVVVFDPRPHVGGNCHTELHPGTSVMVHRYGPHIFNTNDQFAWDYVNQFDEFYPFQNRVIAHTHRGVFSLPINLLTINQFFNTALGPAAARDLIRSKAIAITGEPRNFEEAALSRIGPELYEAFFYGYTKKQWGRDPRELPASVFARLPIRFNYDSTYFSSKYQGIPKKGYSHIVRELLSHPNIRLCAETPLQPEDCSLFQHTFFSGPLDAFFDYEFGRLSYRTLKFEWSVHEGDFQGNPVVNYCNPAQRFTRKTEYQHFAPWNPVSESVVSTEYSHATRPGDTPYYPVRGVEDKELLTKYVSRAHGLRNVTFVGRLGTYRYLNMDQVVSESLRAAHAFLANEGRLPPFVVHPLTRETLISVPVTQTERPNRAPTRDRHARLQ